MTHSQSDTCRSLDTCLFIGIDIASESFHATIADGPQDVVAGPTRLANEPEGFGRMTEWLADRGTAPDTSIVCMEATGVYSEALCYFLDERGYRVAVEDPLRIKRGFKTAANKTDPADSRQIAEYAARYEDKLHLWRPNDAVVDQVKTLLSMREQLVRERGAKQNMLHALKRKAIETPVAHRLTEEMIAYLGTQTQEIEAEIQRLIRSRPALSEGVTFRRRDVQKA